jgi:Mn2+/Fe2+ NRAMP family transporter
MGWSEGLERRVQDARGFYSVIAVSVLLALVIQFSPIDPMKALFWSAVINGVVAVPLMAVIIILASRKSVMGAYTATRSLIVLGWIGTAVMGVAALCMLIPS